MLRQIFRLVTPAILAGLLLALSGCAGLAPLLQNPNYIYEDGAVLVDGSDAPVELKNNPEAQEVSYTALLDFLHRDKTDLYTYVERDNPEGLTPFVCSDFAEMLHNNAEAAGIKAAYVSIDWVSGEIGHAVNAFNTTDKGLVFIDCTGDSLYSQMEANADSVSPGSWDKVAYLVEGRKYGVIAIAYAADTDYSFYEHYEEMWEELKSKTADYNAEVQLFNQELSENVYIEGSPELAEIQAWEKRLDEQEALLRNMMLEVGESRFRPLGIVSHYSVHW